MKWIALLVVTLLLTVVTLGEILRGFIIKLS